jgi:hypothetical protein
LRGAVPLSSFNSVMQGSLRQSALCKGKLNKNKTTNKK